MPGVPIKSCMSRELTPTPTSILATLRPKQRIAIEYAARGYSDSQIAELTKIQRSSIYRWRHKPWYSAAVGEAIAALTGDPRDTFRPMLPDAQRVYRDRLQGNDRHLAQDVMDRLFGKPIESRFEARSIDVNVVFQPAKGLGDVVDAEAVRELGSADDEPSFT